MEIVGKKRLEKLKRKNKGNIALKTAIDNLIRDLENHTFQTQGIKKYTTRCRLCSF